MFCVKYCVIWNSPLTNPGDVDDSDDNDGYLLLLLLVLLLLLL